MPKRAMSPFSAIFGENRDKAIPQKVVIFASEKKHIKTWYEAASKILFLFIYINFDSCFL